MTWRCASDGSPARRPQAGPGNAAADRDTRGVNQRWSLDFVADQFADGCRFRNLEVYDDSLGYLTPTDYARALSRKTGRRAANPDHSARRPLASGDHEGSDQLRTLVMAG